MNRPVVSAICPCYGMSEYLEVFLDSLQQQSMFPHFELILDLNAPSDSDLRIVAKAQKKLGDVLHLNLVSNVDPLYVSMNRALGLARGKYVALWNADDLRTPQSLESQFNFLESSTRHLAVYGPFMVVRRFQSRRGRVAAQVPVPSEELTKGMHLGPFFMFRRSIVESIGGFDEQFQSGSDFDMAVRIALRGEVGHVQDLLGFYLNAGKGSSTRPDSVQALEATAICLRYGILERVDRGLIPESSRYCLPMIKYGDGWIALTALEPRYKDLVDERLANWSRRRYLSRLTRSIRRRIRRLVMSVTDKN